MQLEYVQVCKKQCKKERKEETYEKKSDTKNILLALTAQWEEHNTQNNGE